MSNSGSFHVFGFPKNLSAKLIPFYSPYAQRFRLPLVISKRSGYLLFLAYSEIAIIYVLKLANPRRVVVDGLLRLCLMQFCSKKRLMFPFFAPGKSQENHSMDVLFPPSYSINLHIFTLFEG